MQTHRLVVTRDGRLVGHLDLASTQAHEDVAPLRAALAAAGYATDHHVAQHERRIVEFTPGATRILLSEPLYEPAGTPAG